MTSPIDNQYTSHIESVIKRVTDSTRSTTSGQTDAASRERSTTSGQTNTASGQASTTFG